MNQSNFKHPTRIFTPEFKHQIKEKIVKLHIEEGRTPSSLAKEYSVLRSTIASRINKYCKECKETDPVDSNKSPKAGNKLKMLREKVFELEKENSFLKKTAAFFVKEIDS